MGIQIHKMTTLQINAYSDADWIENVDDRSNLVSLCAKKQSTVSRSSTEVEYRSLALTCTEILWLQHLLHEILPSSQPIPQLWCDNIGATFLAANPMFHARMKYIEINFHFVWERTTSNQLQVRFVCLADQLANVMTKPLPLPCFVRLRNKLNAISIPLACGGVLRQLVIS
jgi:hypothetical protein